MTALNIAEDIETLITVPGFKLHELKGNRRGEWSIYVTGNRRVTFKFEDGYAYDVDLEDYH